METRTYSDLYALVEALCGVSFATVEQPRIKALINRRATKAYRATNFWPRFLVVAEERVVTASVVPYEELDLQSIDTFLRIQQTGSTLDYIFHVAAAGATLVAGLTEPETAAVTYHARHTAIYGDGSTDSSTVPKEWFEYMAHGTYADFLRSEGQQEKAVIADAEASELLLDELMRADEQIPTFLKGRISTYSTWQASGSAVSSGGSSSGSGSVPDLDGIFNEGF